MKRLAVLAAVGSLMAITSASTYAFFPASMQRDEGKVGCHAINTEPHQTRCLAKNGDDAAQARLGEFYGEGVYGPVNCAKAVKWYRKAAAQRNPHGLNGLGIYYTLGCSGSGSEGVAIDYAKAIELFHNAANQGYAPAEYNIGVAYAHGWGVDRDLENAFYWHHRAAEGGYANAQLRLGYAYEMGEGVPRNHGEAFRWYHTAANQGSVAAHWYLGDLYERGHIVDQNVHVATLWYRKAAEQGSYDSASALARLYGTEGLLRNYVLSYKWYSVATTLSLSDLPCICDLVHAS